MSNFTDKFIERPVLATVVSLLILILGINSIYSLQLRQYPKIESSVITITTTYPGASAETVQGYITSVLEQSIASADGLDYFTSSSSQSISVIKVNVQLNFDPYSAYTSVLSKVQEVIDTLPDGARTPVIEQSSGQPLSMMYIGYSSSSLSTAQITSYLENIVQTQLETINGVASAKILGGNTYAMRVWLDRDKMSSLGISPIEVTNALTSNNYQSSGGTVEAEYVQVNISAETGLESVEKFKNLVVRTASDGQLIYLNDIARVELGSSTYTSSVYHDNVPSVVISIDTTSSANPLTVITSVKEELSRLANNYPKELKSDIIYDATDYIRDSIKEVQETIIEAAAIVTLVIFLFLGSIRSVIIPVVTLPLSLIGVFSIMQLMGYSINLLTLLALVLAIGLVVDDAIVVLENTYRLIEKGHTAVKAAIIGAREITGPVISMTVTLVAVYAPIGLTAGLTGALFTEFAFTLAGSVVVSGVIALTLTPMMCSKMLSKDIGKKKFVKFIDGQFSKLQKSYHRKLEKIIQNPGPIMLLGLITIVSNTFLFTLTPKELAPIEDQGLIVAMATAPEYSNLNYLEKYSNSFLKEFKKFPSFSNSFVLNGGANASQDTNILSIMMLKPWSERNQSQETIYRELSKNLHFNPGLQIIPVQLSSLPTSTGTYPIEFVLTTTESYKDLHTIANKFKEEALATGKFLFLIDSLEYTHPQYILKINSKKAAQLGITMQNISNTLGLSLSGNYIGNFTMYDKSYKVIPQLDNQYRTTHTDLAKITLTNSQGQKVSLDSIAEYVQETTANALTRHEQLNSATIQGTALPGLVSTQEALTTLQEVAKKVLPNNYSYSYTGDLKTYADEGNSLIWTFLLSILIIYLVLSAQFESFKDPLVILTSVPMAICGALIPLCMGLATINIYSEIGLITLVGLISKHGILMVEFAKEYKLKHNESSQEAILEAASTRLRPVLMTTAAMVLGVLPLLISQGPGAISRFDIGITIASGMSIGTLFTLFVVPTIYTLKTKDILSFWAIAILIAAGCFIYI